MHDMSATTRATKADEAIERTAINEHRGVTDCESPNGDVRWMHGGITVGALMLAGSIASAGQTCEPSDLFAPAVEYAVETGPRSVAIGDLNGDNASDLAVANSGGVSVLLNNGDGTFAKATNDAAGNDPRTVAIGDLDGDGDGDLAVSNQSSDDVSVLLNNGEGTFADAVNYNVGNRPEFVAIGDLNGDGANDLATANRFGGNLSVLLNDGDGTFADAVNYDVNGEPRSVGIGDLNGDGANDLAAANYSSDFANGVALVLLNNGDGTFAEAIAYGEGAVAGSRLVAIGDLNGDGDGDLAVSNLASEDVSVLLNHGNGTFAAAITYDVESEPFSVAVGDLNGDDAKDLAVTNFTGDVSVLLNNGEGIFADAIEFSAGTEPQSVAIGDLNGDDANDLAVANDGSHDVSVLLNQCMPDHVPGDLNGDGVINVADLLILLGEWGRCADREALGNCPADLDNDDHVGVGDLLILLANWG